MSGDNKKKTFIGELFKQYRLYECEDINGDKINSFWKRNKRIMLCSVLSMVLTLFTPGGLTQDFVSLASTILSILVGLFLTTLIFALDKFYTPSKKQIEDYEISLTEKEIDRDIGLSIKPIEEVTTRKNTWEKQAYYFSKQFVYMTGANIVFAIWSILLLLINTLFFEFLSVNPMAYTFEISNWSNVISFIHILATILLRFGIIYLILIVLYNTIYVVSSMVNYMTAKIERTQ